jgi:hypothetical protein
MAKLPTYMQHAIKKPAEIVPFNPATELDALTEIAMKQKRIILETELPGPKDNRPEAQRTRALVLAAADSTINQKIKVDETAMVARRSQELLPELLARIEAALRGQP